MEEIDLTSADYWEGNGIDIRLNPAVVIDTSGIANRLRDMGVDSAVVLATSGSEGQPKLIVLEKCALLASAEAVNEYCSIDSKDVWLGCLSTFHVGGLGICARAFLSKSKVNVLPWDAWTRDGKAFLEACEDSTITSLTPVHLFDLVNAGRECPPSLRGVFIGGGALSDSLSSRARDLGWPLWTTYGMTESASQISTSLEGSLHHLPILPIWATKTTRNGVLQIKGPALMRGYFRRSHHSTKWHWCEAQDEAGFYTTGDLVELNEDSLTPLGRADDQVKIRGELVSIGKLEKSISEALGRTAVVLAKPHERLGNQLSLLIEGADSIGVRGQLAEWNLTLPPYERIEEESVFFFDRFPRTEVGKIDKSKLKSGIV